MKKSIKKIYMVSIVACIFSGCGGITWVNLDQTQASDIAIKEAKQKCDYDKKMYDLNSQLQVIEYTSFALKNSANADAKQTNAWEKEATQKAKTAVYTELETCMKAHGLEKLK